MSRFRQDWDEERIEKLKLFWGQGLTALQVAKAMADGTTRSAVCGKVKRLKLVSRLDPKAEQVVQRRSEARADPHLKQPKPIAAAIVEMVAAPPLVLSDGSFVTMDTVSGKTCRWPIGDPAMASFHFCGNTPRHGAPYCSAHCKIAYTPAHDRHNRDEQRRPANRIPNRRGQISLWE